ncbi:MAG: hypothetical protein LKI24_07725 [Acidipropionibacterium sp.]|nr:hypothetical protein [Acidipropionibacterium sp.]
MDTLEYRRQEMIARRLIEIVGTTRLVDELLRQAEAEEAVDILRHIAEKQNIELPEELAA